MFRTNPPCYSSSFDAVYQEFYKPVLSLAKKYLRNHHAAEDIAQDVFLKLWQNDLADIDNLQAWLRTVTIHACIDYSTSFSSKRSKSLPHPETVPSRATDLPEQNEAVQMVRTAIGKLSDTYRSTAHAVYVDGSTLADTARAQGLTLGTVKRRLHAMRNRLAAVLVN